MKCLHRMVMSGICAGLSWLMCSCMISDSKNELFASDKNQLQLRNIQSRAFDTTDQNKTMRAVMATLQDLSFVIEKVDTDLGIVTGTKYESQELRMTVSVRPKNSKQLMVRANAQIGKEAVEDPLPYQEFFSALEKAMFLAAQQVN